MSVCINEERNRHTTLTNVTVGSLQWLDWSVIVVVLLVPGLIGIYYRFSGGRQKTIEEYFLANHSLSSIFVACVTTIVAVSALGMLAVSSESYIYGMQFNMINVGLALSAPIVAYLYLPVFFKLRHLSVYEYLEARFGPTARLTASIGNYGGLCLLTGVTLYVPALTLEAITGLSGTIIVVLISLICTFYTTIGGIKAVLAADIFQGLLMMATVCCVIGVGCYDSGGGISEVFENAAADGRLNFFNFDMDPTVRHTWWSLVIGGFFLDMSELGVNPIVVQRLLSARSLKLAQIGLLIIVPLMAGICFLISVSGLVLYTWFKGCDPMASDNIASYDQIMPYFAKVRLSEIPGLLGFFIAGIFGASLGTSSAILNSLSAIAVADYVKPLYRKAGRDFSDSKASFFAKILGVVNGLLCMVIALLASRMGSLLQTTLAIKGAIGGPILGLFSLGLFVEAANEKGAVVGSVLGLALTSWMSFGQPKPPIPELPVSIDKCFNSTLTNSTTYYQLLDSGNIDDSNYFALYRISYMWSTFLGFAATMIFGYVASVVSNYFANEPPATPNPDLFTPLLANHIRRQCENTNKTKSNSIFVIKSDQFRQEE